MPQNHWSGHNPMKWWCRVCSARGMVQTVMFRCVKCDVALCVDQNCFVDYHTKGNLQDAFPSVFHTNSWSLDHNVSKEHGYLQVFFRNIFSIMQWEYYSIFEAYWAILFPSPKNAFCFTNLSCLVLRICRFFKKRAQNLKYPAEQFGEPGLTDGM